MKKITLLSAFLLTFAMNAQVTYNSSDFAAAGEEFTVTKASSFAGVNFATTGANQNWNYSNLQAGTQSTTGYQNPNGSGYKLSWCLSHFYIFNCNSQFNNNFTHSTLVSDGIELMDYGVANIVEHARANATTFENRMRGLTATISGISVPMTVEYDNPDEIYHFPMTYNDSYTTTGHLNMNLNNLGVPFSYTLATQRTNNVQGWGSITTPMGTFPNVLKLKTVLQKTETYVYNGISIPIPTTTVSYQWFSPDYGIPVLQADGFEIFNIFIPTSVTYIDQPLCLPANAEFAYLPVGNYDADSQSATVPFINLSTNYTAVSWDFGDGTTSTEATPSHVYNCPGTHQVTLTVTNNACTPNTTDTFTLPVVVTDTQNALTTAITLGDNMLTADRDLPGTTYQWVNCDNANAPIAGQTSQSFSPTADGNYACIISTNGCESVSPCTPFTLCLAANASFSSSTTVDFDPIAMSATASFENLSANYSSVSWDFGDGMSSTEANPTHSYSCIGVYTATLTVNNGCTSNSSDVFIQTITVTDTQNVLTTSITVGDNMLTADRNLPGTTYQWVDCDNSNSEILGETNQTFMPLASGNYACLIATNGCESISECTSFTLCVAATAEFSTISSADFDSVAMGAIVSFTNMSADFTSISWNFGDGETSTDVNPVHTFTCPGIYEVAVTVANTNCSANQSNTFVLPIEITDTQNVMVSTVTVTATELTADRDLAGTTYQWIDCDNGNSEIDGANSQVFTPTVSGNYACHVNTNGCEATSECMVFSLLATAGFDNGQFELYPNPTTGQLYLSNNTMTVKSIEVYNSLGMLVGKDLDISRQATGIYFVKITAEEGSFIRKIVKQ